MAASFNGIIEVLDIQPSRSGILSGKTFVAKDLFDLAGHITGAGNPDWKRTHAPAPKNAEAVQLLLDAGARLTGKSCTDELAFSLDGINLHYGTPVNPNYPGRIPGGSSSGSASAVSAGLCDFAIGTDTAGSIRVPSAYCGIFGMRPTHGRISVDGVVALGRSFDTVGWMARSAETLAEVGKVLLPVSKIEAQILPSNTVLVGNSMNLLDEQLREPFENACKQMLGDKQLKTISMPENALEDCSALFGTIRSYEAWKEHGEWFKQIDPHMSEPIKTRFLGCEKITQQDSDSAREARYKIQIILNELLADCVLCVPAIWNFPPENTASEAELSRNRINNLRLNSIASFGGLPQIVVPVSMPGSPAKFAISFISAAGTDLALLNYVQRICIKSS